MYYRILYVWFDGTSSYEDIDIFLKNKEAINHTIKIFGQRLKDSNGIKSIQLIPRG